MFGYNPYLMEKLAFAQDPYLMEKIAYVQDATYRFVKQAEAEGVDLSEFSPEEIEDMALEWDAENQLEEAAEMEEKVSQAAFISQLSGEIMANSFMQKLAELSEEGMYDDAYGYYDDYYGDYGFDPYGFDPYGGGYGGYY